jgi:hypothetical protein
MEENNMKNWEEYETVEDVLRAHYANINSHWAQKFAKELLERGYADRSIRGIVMRRNHISINLHFQAKKNGEKLYARYITKK